MELGWAAGTTLVGALESKPRGGGATLGANRWMDPIVLQGLVGAALALALVLAPIACWGLGTGTWWCSDWDRSSPAHSYQTYLLRFIVQSQLQSDLLQIADSLPWPSPSPALGNHRSIEIRDGFA